VASSNSSHIEQCQNPNYTASRPEIFAFGDSNMPLNDILDSGLALGQPNDPGTFDALDPFSGFDIPFWFEQDQYWNVFQDFD
jgi:hypothetical protein